jgi:hypothetical protein
MSRCPTGLRRSSAIIWRERRGEGEWRGQRVGGVTNWWPRSALRVPPLPCVGFGLGAPDGTLRHTGQNTDLAAPRLGGIFQDDASI